MDQIDKQIIEMLKNDSKQNFKSIGEQIHMTGQAVGNRVRKLEDDGIIEGYTIKLNPQKQGVISANITLFMKGNDHYRLKQFVYERAEILEVQRVSGEGCYILRVETESHDKINALCDDLLSFANYKLSIVTDRIK